MDTVFSLLESDLHGESHFVNIWVMYVLMIC